MNIRTKTKLKAIIKSTKPAIIGESGINILGKYIFVKILIFPIKLIVDLFTDDEKYVQGTRAV